MMLPCPPDAGWELIRRQELPRRAEDGRPLGGFSAVAYERSTDRLCRARLEGRPPKSSSSAAVRATDTSSSATTSSSSSSSDSEARDAALAALKDQLELIQKQISGFT